MKVKIIQTDIKQYNLKVSVIMLSSPEIDLKMFDYKPTIKG